jgi:hypothetical protein
VVKTTGDGATVITGTVGLNEDNDGAAGAVITAVGIVKTDDVGMVAAAVCEIITTDGDDVK